MNPAMLEFMNELAKSMFQPIIQTFTENDVDYAVREEVYLPELVATLAPQYLVQLKQIASSVPKSMIDQFELKHLLMWMKEKEPAKYKWFIDGNYKHRKRLQWLKWNVEGFKKYVKG